MLIFQIALLAVILGHATLMAAIQHYGIVSKQVRSYTVYTSPQRPTNTYSVG